MTVYGKLAMAEHALREIFKARATRSFLELDRAIESAKVIYDDMNRWARVVPIKAIGTK